MSRRWVAPSAVLLALLLCASPALPSLWSAQELVGIADGYHDYDPEVAIDPQGRAWIVWMGVDDGAVHDYEIYWSRWEQATGWSPRQRVHADNTLYDSWPRMSMAPDGTPWIAWLRLRSNGYQWDLLSTRWTGSGWASASVVIAAPGISDANYFGLAPIDSARCWIVYDLSYQMCAREYDFDQWGPAESVASGLPDDPWQVDAAIGPDGEPWAIWSDSSIRATRRDSNGAWDSPAFLNSPGGGGGLPAIAIDSRGDAWAVWADFSDVCPPNDWPDVFFTRTVAGVWQPAGVLNDYETSGCGSDAGPDISAAYGWPPRSVWSRKPGGASVAYYDVFSSTWASEAWSPQAQMNQPESTFREDSFPTVAVGPQGQAWAAWKRPTTTQASDVYASRLLLDVVQFGVERTPMAVEVSWRLIGYAPPSNFLFRVMRLDDFGDTTQVAEAPGDGTDYHVFDETAAPGLRYSYWIEARDPIEWIDPPASSLLFRTASQVVEPQMISVEEPSSHDRACLRVSPNPTNGTVEFELTTGEGGSSLEVFDVQGRLVWRGSVPSTVPGRVVVRWSRDPSAPTGVFWARLRDKKGGILTASKFLCIH